MLIRVFDGRSTGITKGPSFLQAKNLGSDQTDFNSLNTHADISIEAGCLIIGLGLHLHPYFVYGSRIGSGEVVAHQWNKVPKINQHIKLSRP